MGGSPGRIAWGGVGMLREQARPLAFLMSTTLVLVASCNLPRAGAQPSPTTPVQVSGEVTPAVLLQETRPSTGDRTGEPFGVETANLRIDYPGSVDPAEARKHAETLQAAYEVYEAVFAIAGEEPSSDQHVAIIFDASIKGNFASRTRVVIGSATLGQIIQGRLNPPDRTFMHEMVHVFEEGEVGRREYHVFNLITGMNEALAEYFVCHPGVFPLWADGENATRHCDLVLHGIGAKSPDFTLGYYEERAADPYTLDWGLHPAGASGEVYFEQMLARVSDEVGWGVWQRYFSQIRDRGGSAAAREAYETKRVEIHDPLLKQAFADFISGLSEASGRDLRPMFRAWGFEL